MIKCGIYKITNQVNGKVYIGQSVNIFKRWKDHKQKPFQENSEEYNYPLYQAIREEGLENFTFEILEECSPEDLNQKEIGYISLYESYPPDKGKGYNQTKGGDNFIAGKLDSFQLDIKQLILDGESFKNISQIYQITLQSIYDINCGKSYFDPDLNYPLKNLQHSGRFTLNRPKNFCPMCGKEIEFGSKTCAQCRPKKQITSVTKKKRHYRKRDKLQIQTQKCPLCGKEVSENTKSGLCQQCFQKGVEWNSPFRTHSTKVLIPPREEVLKILYENKTDQQAADYYKISTVLLKKWKIELEIPRNKKEVDKLYEEEYLGVIKEEKPKRVIKYVLQISLETGEILNEFESCSAAERFLGVKNGGSVNNCCLGKIKKSYGYFWKYKD